MPRIPGDSSPTVPAKRTRPERLGPHQVVQGRDLQQGGDADLPARIRLVSGHQRLRLRRRMGLNVRGHLHDR